MLIKLCEECGKEIIVKSLKKRFCSECHLLYTRLQNKLNKRYNPNKRKWDKNYLNTESGKAWKKRDNAKYYPKYLKKYPYARIALAMRNRLNSLIKNGKLKRNKSKKIFDFIGCTKQELIKYLELKFKEGMSWENYGSWHIDHIIPCAAFDLTKIEEQNKCFHYSNLQPLWASENLKKRDKII